MQDSIMHIVSLLSIGSFMGRGVIDLPLEQIAVFVCMEESYYAWDRFLTVSVLIVMQ